MKETDQLRRFFWVSLFFKTGICWAVISVLGGGFLTPFAFGTEKDLSQKSRSQSREPSGQKVYLRCDLVNLPDIIEPLLPAVVNISTITEVSGAQRLEIPSFPPGSPMEEFFRRFFEEQRPRKITSLGSGFIISQEKGQAFIVTCNHVIANAEKIKVIFHDNTEEEAQVVGRDRRTDLALLKIKVTKSLTTVQWGDSDHARVGETVIAIGNPFGLGGTATKGIISAIARDIGGAYVPGYFQIDASINMGNSGGPMFNIEGKILGINTAIFSPNGGNIGIGFAIPSSIAKGVIQQLKDHGHTIRGWLGVQIQPVTREIATSLGLKEVTGALVGDISKKGPASKAGFKEGDVILMFNGKLVKESRQLPMLVGESQIGKSVPVVIWRNGKKLSLNVAVGEFEKAEKAGWIRSERHKDSPLPKESMILGMVLRPLTPEICEELNLTDIKKGVIIEYVDPLGPAADKFLKKDDIILKAIFGSQQVDVTTPEELKKIIQQRRQKEEKTILLLIQREGSKYFIALSLEEKKKDENPKKRQNEEKDSGLDEGAE